MCFARLLYGFVILFRMACILESCFGRVLEWQAGTGYEMDGARPMQVCYDGCGLSN